MASHLAIFFGVSHDSLEEYTISARKNTRRSYVKKKHEKEHILRRRERNEEASEFQTESVFGDTYI